jgi:poly(3-hydroxybutyrate) depolymerase
VPPGPRRLFDRIDSNGDGQVTLAEHRAGGRQSPPPQTKKPPERQGPSSTGLIHHAIRQAWPQEPQGVQRPYTIKLPDQTVDRWPIVILLHGNGGEGARMIGNWPGLLPGWLVVAPQGYERSWNISTERSKAPDVTFIKQVLADVGRRYPQADGSRVSLIGSSNGAGMVFRLLIELDETVTVRHAVTLVSSMTTGQYHNGQFWKRANEATAVYDMPVVPVGKRRILTIHGTADTVVPYGGGRGPGGTHLSAQATAYAWAVQQGYQGRAVPDDAGRSCGEGLIRYDYPAAKVSHIKVVAGRHGLGPAKTAVEAIVTEFLLAEQRAH